MSSGYGGFSSGEVNSPSRAVSEPIVARPHEAEKHNLILYWFFASWGRRPHFDFAQQDN